MPMSWDWTSGGCHSQAGGPSCAETGTRNLACTAPDAQSTEKCRSAVNAWRMQVAEACAPANLNLHGPKFMSRG